MEKERIGIFGCSADPFTLAHREIVKEVLEQKLVDAVIIAPTIVDYHRGDKLPWLSSNEKLSVIRALTGDLHPVFIDETELNRKDLVQLSPELQEHAIKSWRFIDTLLRIKLEYMNGHRLERELYPIIGGDSLDNFKTWFAWKDILKQSAGIIAVERDNKTINVKKLVAETPEFDGKLKVMKIYDGFAEMSASDMREMWRNQLPTEYLDWALATVEANKAARRVNDREKNLLLHTPIFDVVKGQKTMTGLEPVLVKAPDWVTVIVKDKDGKLLIVKQLRYGSECEIEEFPCGMVEKDETPQEAAVRELEEETGIKLLARRRGVYLGLEKIGCTNPNPAFMTNQMHYFYLDLQKADYEIVKQNLDEHEQITYVWEDCASFIQRMMHMAEFNNRKVPAILLSAFALWMVKILKDTHLGLFNTLKWHLESLCKSSEETHDEDIDELVKICEEEEKKALERGDPKAIEAAIGKEYVESHDLGPDEYDLQYQEMVDMANDPELKRPLVEHY